ncbi:arylcarboxylate reductase [Streptomyces sp. ME19-01-6]|uniref:arylcarboxylate reductase n=1 Tax=Streptomyces sp. ME19-01-6 TaxID=3028686 RepID=UPI0029A84C59|nr:arylcarboxylate reductase [Streptomyces sp. ME19-01-6]MDX3233697.1 arylcarboxylate reductase [Streptomyces sp. ME19-01-6]
MLTDDTVIKELLAQDLDHWTRRVIRRHFTPVTGSHYWLRRAADLSFDPRDITRYEELCAFGPFPLEELRTLDPAELVPQAVPRPLTGKIWESGGTTGTPCRVHYTEPMLRNRADWLRWALPREGFLPGRSWLQATPTGPHLVGNRGWHLAEHYDSRVYGVDFDPRWVKRLVRAGRMKEVQEYTDHVLEQIALILSSQPVDYLMITPALFQALIRKHPEPVAELKGARISGTHVTTTMYRSFVAAMPDAPVIPMYGNTFGNALALPVQGEGQVMPYMSTYPQVTHSVVDPGDWTRVVEYGRSGQVRLTVLHDDLFVPNILERDAAVRHDTGDEWPWDGVANVRPLQSLRAVPEGIY